MGRAFGETTTPVFIARGDKGGNLSIGGACSRRFKRRSERDTHEIEFSESTLGVGAEPFGTSGIGKGMAEGGVQGK